MGRDSGGSYTGGIPHPPANLCAEMVGTPYGNSQKVLQWVEDRNANLKAHTVLAYLTINPLRKCKLIQEDFTLNITKHLNVGGQGRHKWMRRQQMRSQVNVYCLTWPQPYQGLRPQIYWRSAKPSSGTSIYKDWPVCAKASNCGFLPQVTASGVYRGFLLGLASSSPPLYVRNTKHTEVLSY